MMYPHPYPYIHWQLEKWLNSQKVSSTCKRAVNMLQDPTLTDERVTHLVERIKEGTKLTQREKALIKKEIVPHARALAMWNRV